MPHLFVNRRRLHALTSDSADLKSQFWWEAINAVSYEIGGLIFIAGSVLFFPRYDEFADDGAWLFFVGSLIYLVVTCHDMTEAIRHRRSLSHPTKGTVLELTAAFTYVCGSVLFAVGSIFFLSSVDLITQGAWCFIVGSILFAVGAAVNVLQIVEANSIDLLQMMNLTAVTFVVGSVLFAVASVPYIWTVAPTDEEKLYSFLAWQYTVGSILFLVGGIFNHCRAHIFVKKKIDAAFTGPVREKC